MPLHIPYDTIVDGEIVYYCLYQMVIVEGNSQACVPVASCTQPLTPFCRQIDEQEIAKMSIDLKFVKLTADVLENYL